MNLTEGVYEDLINNELNQAIEDSDAANIVCKTDDIDSAESPQMLANYVAKIVHRKLTEESLSNEERIRYVNNILQHSEVDNDELLVITKQYLSAVISKQKAAALSMTRQHIVRPESGFRVSNLFTGGQSALSLSSEIVKDIASADQICLIVSFLRMSGIRIMYDALKTFCSQEGHSLRIITTTYCGATEVRAVKQLAELPNTEIRISYNTDIERLHAKSYIFVRNSGYSTAYIGSSNLSKSAHTDGLEWNIRTTNIENPHIIKTALATFDMYWNSPNFEDFREGGVEKLYAELKKQKTPILSTTTLFKYTILPHQKVILDKIQTERNINNVYRNLIVAATGTGKTVVSAFDYLYYSRKNPQRCKLLFIAHRQEILRQALRTYRSVMQDANFGDLWVGDYRPSGSIDALFASVSMINSNLNYFQELGIDYYDYIVFDEAHHIAAESYQRLINFFKPKILLGLTATPERMDGKSLLPDFDNRITAEIRLPKALHEGLLTPFQYLCITDVVDFSTPDLWGAGKYLVEKLSETLCDVERVNCIYNALLRYLPDEQSCKALCFCVNKKHADFMASEFRKLGLKAASLTSDSDKSVREYVNKELAEGKINYLFVVDIFNEGVDIPEVDTVLFLRPTESLTIFLQQLGRGLRLCVGKSLLTVLDFVGQANKNYDYTSRFRSLLLDPTNDVREQVEKGFSMLPHGCYIHMEEKAQKFILDNISAAIYNVRRLEKELRIFTQTPTLSQFIKAVGQDIRLIYKGNLCWTSLKARSGKCNYFPDVVVQSYEKGMGMLIHINSVAYIRYIKKFLQAKCNYRPENEAEEKFELMLYYSLYQKKIQDTPYESVKKALALLANYPLFMKEIDEIMDYLLDNLQNQTYELGEDMPKGLELYGCYTREEVFTFFGRQTATKKMQGSVAGVFKIDELNTELFFVTLNKSDKDFSPTTQYEDYLISETKFHWQSQNTDSHERSGQRFVQQKENGKRFLLFVREEKKDAFGNTMPFHCFGFIDYIDSHDDYPMSIEWRLQEPAMPLYLKNV